MDPSLSDCFGTEMKPNRVVNWKDPKLSSYDFKVTNYPPRYTSNGLCGEFTGMMPKRTINTPQRHVGYYSWGEFSGMMPKRTINTPQRNKGYNSCGGPVRDNYGLLQ